MLAQRQLVGCMVDVWCNDEELLIESCAVRARIEAILNESCTVFHLNPIRIWVTGSSVWCWHIQGVILEACVLDPRARSEPEGIYSCSLLVPSGALELDMLNAWKAVVYPKNAVTPAEPNQFLLGERRVPAVVF